jgi:predicted ATPase
MHEAVGSTLEMLYEGQAEALASISGQLAWHFQEAGMAAKAVEYLHRAGDRAVRLCAYEEAMPHLASALDLLMTAPSSPERDQKELELQISLGIAWVGRAVFADEQVGATFSRARELCQQLGRESQLCHVLGELSVFHYVRAEHHRARELAEEALGLAQQVGDPLYIALCHWYLGLVLFALGELPAARTHLGEMIAFYDPLEHSRLLLSIRGSDGGASALSYDACCLWALGFPEQAAQRSQESLGLARKLDHAYTLADVISFAGCMFHRMRGDAGALMDHATALTDLSHQAEIPGWAATGSMYRGQALAMLGEVQEGITQMKAGIAAMQSVSAGLYQPEARCILAQGQAQAGMPEEGLTTVEEALTVVEETGEHLWEAEVHRTRGELLLMTGHVAAAEASYHSAIEVARRQEAKSWELRAAMGLARLWRAEGKAAEAREMLAEVYDWFTEGLETPDLREARQLLDQLSREPDAEEGP